MNKKKIIIAIIVVLLLIVAAFAGITIYKASILNNLVAKGLETREVRNYHMKIESEADDGIDMEVWVKDDEHFLTKFIGKNNDRLKITMYRNGNEQLKASEVKGLKGVTRKNASFMEMYTFATYMPTKPSLQEVFRTSIHSTQLEDKECYEISLENGVTVWVEKETSLVLKIQTAEEGIANCTYEIGTVTDADIQKPDVTGYPEM